MRKNYKALWESLALHFCLVSIIYIGFSYTKKPKIISTKPASISIDIIQLALINETEEPELPIIEKQAETPILNRVQEENNIDEKQAEIIDPEHKIDTEVEETDTKKIDSDLKEIFFTLKSGEVISLSDWVLRGLDKDKADTNETPTKDILSLEEIANAHSLKDIDTSLNPLMGDGSLPAGTLNMPSIRKEPGAMPSIISARHMRRKEGAYTGGLYGSNAPLDINSSGTSIIQYEANISNCAHEEARTGVNRCRAFERWISQRVHKVLKAQEKN